MNAARWVAAGILAAAVTVVWALPTVLGPSVTCIDIDPVSCERAWRARADESGRLPFLPVVKVTVWGNGACTLGNMDWIGGGLIWAEDCM